MINYRSRLHSIEFQIADQENSFIAFHFLYFKENVARLRQDEEDVERICRNLLPDVSAMIEILCKYRVPESNGSPHPQFTYKSTFTRPEKLYFKVAYSLTNVAPDGNPLQMFSLLLRLRNVVEDENSIRYGRFDLTLQNFKLDHLSELETGFDQAIIDYFNSKLVYLTMPIRNMIEYITQKSSLKIMLSNGRLQKEDFDEDQEEALISEGIIVQLSEKMIEWEHGRIQRN